MRKEITFIRSIRRFVITTLVLWLACGAHCVFAQTVATPPEVKSFQLGVFKITVLRDGAFVFPNNGAIFGINAGKAAVAKALVAGGAASDKIRLDVDTLLIRMPHRIVLVDTGYGPAAHGVLPESLALAGVSPGDITDVLITHAHFDHVGGLVDAQGHSAFPKATIRLSAKEWKFMQTEAKVSAEIPVISVQVKTFEPGHQVLPGITSLSLPGHTPGHVGYEIASQGLRFVDVGDIVHNSIISVAHPGWILAWDSNKTVAVKTRRQELQRLAETRELMFAPHFPFPGVGRIEKIMGGFRFRPYVP